jgi:hypothetical protein
VSQELSEHAQATTTVEEDKHTASQRDINQIWETTQSRISLMVVGTTCLVVTVSVLLRAFLPVALVAVIALPAEWWTIVGLVVGFYFGRTNHSRVGGVQLGR